MNDRRDDRSRDGEFIEKPDRTTGGRERKDPWDTVLDTQPPPDPPASDDE